MGLFWFLLPLSTFTGRGSGDQVSMVWNGTFPINNVWEWAIRMWVSALHQTQPKGVLSGSSLMIRSIMKVVRRLNPITFITVLDVVII